MTLETSTPEILAANLVVLLAATLQAATGIGFAMVAVPLLALISLAWVPAPMLICNIALSLIVLARGRGALDPAERSPLIIGLTIGTVLGAAILTILDESLLGVLIGGIIVTAVTASLLTPPIRITPPRVLVGASMGGVVGVIAAMHGPPLVLLYQREPPEKVRATMAVVFIFGGALALASLWLAELLGPEQIWRGLLLLPGVVAGFVIGRIIGGRMSPGSVRYSSPRVNSMKFKL